MAISNLTGTKWLWNNAPVTGVASSTNFSLDYVSNETTMYVLRCASGGNIVYRQNDNGTIRSFTAYTSSTSTWQNDNYKTIEITGGTDATNATLISIIEANATQIIPIVEISYNSSVIASLSSSGVKVLETNGKLCADDITITYTNTKPPKFVKDGKTRIYIDLMSGYTSPYLCFSINGTAVVDWGDGSSTSTVTGTTTAVSGRIYTQHVYQAAGEYVITITITTGKLYFYGGNSDFSYVLLNASSGYNQYTAAPYRFAITKVEIGTNAHLGANAFRNCKRLVSVYKHSSTSYLSGNNIFYNCTSLTEVDFPSSVSSFGGTSEFYGATSLVDLDLWSMTAIPDSFCRAAAGLVRINIPSTVTSIATKAFYGCTNVLELHFKSSSPPTVDNSDAWTSLYSGCKIYVPTGKLTAYTSATNYPDPNTYTYIEE